MTENQEPIHDQAPAPSGPPPPYPSATGVHLPDPPGAPLAAKSRNLTWLWVAIGVFVGLLVGIGIGSAGSGSDPDADTAASEAPATKKSTTTTKAEPTTTTTARPTTTTAPPYVPVPTDFFIEIVELERSCFGSAGCNVTYTITPTYVGTQPPAAGSSFKVLYDILGAEDPKSGYFTVEGDTVRYTEQDTVSVPPGGTLSALPTRVLEQ